MAATKLYANLVINYRYYTTVWAAAASFVKCMLHRRRQKALSAGMTNPTSTCALPVGLQGKMHPDISIAVAHPKTVNQHLADLAMFRQAALCDLCLDFSQCLAGFGLDNLKLSLAGFIEAAHRVPFRHCWRRTAGGCLPDRRTCQRSPHPERPPDHRSARP